MLSIIPIGAIHSVVLVSVICMLAGVILNMIPTLAKYTMPVIMASAILLAGSMYFEGMFANEASWKEKAQLLENKVAVAEEKASHVNTKIVTQVIREKEIIKQKGATVTEYIERAVSKHNNTCVIPNEAIVAHNAAASNQAIVVDAISTSEHNQLATGESGLKLQMDSGLKLQVASNLKLAPRK